MVGGPRRATPKRARPHLFVVHKGYSQTSLRCLLLFSQSCIAYLYTLSHPSLLAIGPSKPSVDRCSGSVVLIYSLVRDMSLKC